MSEQPTRLIPLPFSAAPDEVEALLGALHRNRRTFAWKTGGLDADAMRRTLGPSTVSLGGLVKHLALVEDHYFSHQLLGRDYPALWAPMAESSGWDWTSAAADSPEELRMWLEVVARSQAAVAASGPGARRSRSGTGDEIECRPGAGVAPRGPAGQRLPCRLAQTKGDPRGEPLELTDRSRVYESQATSSRRSGMTTWS